MITVIKNTPLPLNALISATLALALTASGFAETVTHLGSIVPITSANDLDLEGHIVHAINFRGPEVTTIRGVDFLPDDAIPRGTTLVAPNFASPWQTPPELGDTADDDNLEAVLHTMRWAIGSEQLKASFAVKIGHRYKVQIVFYENRDFNRSWDVSLNDSIVVEEITSLGLNTATYSANRAVMYVFETDASQTDLTIRMGQLNATIDGIDSGSLWQAITLEDLGPGTDGDADGMPDVFESAFGLDVDGDDSTDDPDGDASTNLNEFANSTDPTDPDSDGDSVLDGTETNTGIWVSETDRGTSPLLVDSDGDTISDAAETNTGNFSDQADTGTDPNEMDSDTDGFGDGLEVVLESDPTDIGNVPTTPDQVKLLANWDFDSDDQSTTQVPDSVRSLVAHLQNGASLSNSGGGRSGTPLDRSVQFGLRGGPIVEVAEAAFLNLPSKADTASVSLWQKSTTNSNTTTFWGSTDTPQLRGVSAHLPWSDRFLYFDTAGCCDPESQRVQVSALDGDNQPLVLLERWHHFVLVKNGPTKQIWLDGILLVEAANSAAWPDTFFRLFIGAGPSGARSIFGAIDDFSVFHGALIPAQILSLTTGISPAAISDIEDADGDTLPDFWETANGLSTLIDDSGNDPDSDNSTNIDEFLRSTDPQKADTDGDGYTDGVETDTGVFTSTNDTGTDPLDPDSDGDDVEDGKETGTGIFVDADDRGTNPHAADTDTDGLTDGVESGSGIFVDADDTGTNPLVVDTDGDGSTDLVETNTGVYSSFLDTGTDPHAADSDQDGLRDGTETNSGTFIDADNTGTHPLRDDTDGDGVLDGAETRTGTFVDSSDAGTDPHSKDSDSDTLEDGVETGTGIYLSENDTGTDPNKVDTDGDGFRDDVETATGEFVDANDPGTDPNKSDTDGDALEDNIETATGTFVDSADTGTDPNKPDSDADGLSDGVESATGTFVDNTDTGTDPNNSDSDGDSISDGIEVAAGSDPNDANSGPDSSPPAITSIRYNFDNSEITVTWSSKPSALYTVESSGDLVAWGSHQADISSEGETTSLTISTIALGSNTRYVRVREQ